MNFKIKTFVLLLLCICMVSVVCAEEGQADISGDVPVTYYSNSSTVGQSGYCYSIEYGGNTYYLSTENFNNIVSYVNDDPNCSEHYLTTDEIDNAYNQEGLDIYNSQINNTDFQIKYESGQTVGDDQDANVITHWVINGTDVLNPDDQ